MSTDRESPRGDAPARGADVGDLAFRVTGPERRASDQTPFVLMHGIGVSHRYLSRLHHQLAQTHEVYSIDLPGFGGLPKPAKSPTVTEMARALTRVLEEQQLQGAVLVGHSMGAQWAVEAAVQRPELVSGVVLIGPVADDRNRTFWSQSVALAFDTLGEPLDGNVLVFADYLRCGPRWYLAQLREMLSYPLEKRVGDLAAAPLIVRGGRDPIAGPEWSERLRAHAGAGPLVTVPGHRHLVHHSAPRAVYAAIMAFTAAVPTT